MEIAGVQCKSNVVLLLTRATQNLSQTRLGLQVEFGLTDGLVADLFAAVVFLCDDLLRVKPQAHLTTRLFPSTNALSRRFFNIAVRLPMELQMILCHRAYDSHKENVLIKDSEAAFRSLAALLMASSFR